MSLTSLSCVHSNVHGLGNIHWIRYLTAVDPLHSTSFAVQIYFHLTSVFVEIPLLHFIGNSSVIGKVPGPQGRPSDSIRTSATISEVSHTEQSITSLTNVLQGHTTVVLVCCTFEWEPDIPFTWEESDVNVLCIETLFCTYLKLNFGDEATMKPVKLSIVTYWKSVAVTQLQITRHAQHDLSSGVWSIHKSCNYTCKQIHPTGLHLSHFFKLIHICLRITSPV